MSHLTNWRDLHSDFFAGSQVLVTGGAGFIGSHLSEALIDLGAEVTVLDDLSGGDIVNLAPFQDRADGRLSFVEGSVLNRDLLAKIVPGCRFIYHQAAWGSVPRSVEMPRHYHEVNATGTLNILEAAREAGVQRVLFAASSSAYGDSEVLPKVESMPVQPKSPYAANKCYGEALMRAYAGCYDIDTVSLRYFNIFGPRQNANSAYAAVIAGFSAALLAGQRPRIYGDGEQSRDFTFVENAVQANLLAARAEGPLKGEVLNVACGGRVTVNELAEKMAAILGRTDLQAEHGPERAGDVKHSLAELSKTKAAIGYEPVVEFGRGLEVTLHWYQESQEPVLN